MKVRVLGCSGTIGRDSDTTSFLVDDDILVDAGTGVGRLTLDEMCRISDIFLTHAHMDHIAGLPMMVDAVSAAYMGREHVINVHALPETVDTLRRHMFNGEVWPDFSRLPSPSRPAMRFHMLDAGQVREVAGRVIEVLPANHCVPAVGYAVRARRGGNTPCWVFSGDTGVCPTFWKRISRMDVGALFIETAFSNRCAELAQLSLHMTPAMLADCLERLPPDVDVDYPIYVTHLKPSETQLILSELKDLRKSDPTRRIARVRIQRLLPDTVIELAGEAVAPMPATMPMPLMPEPDIGDVLAPMAA
ncbi:MAG: 3',5'-cyclic-nucleotide phosphodiesterase [Ottowia sp.]|nr:3',5'-cyclic-nucleotide phosphodiesterase [Ottowia sp.]